MQQLLSVFDELPQWHIILVGLISILAADCMHSIDNITNMVIMNDFMI